MYENRIVKLLAPEGAINTCMYSLLLYAPRPMVPEAHDSKGPEEDMSIEPQSTGTAWVPAGQRLQLDRPGPVVYEPIAQNTQLLKPSAD